MSLRHERRFRVIAFTVVAAAIGAALQGCSLLSRDPSIEEELERVAKDWCMTIRASQVLCTYPLTEDL